jgi:hypothetical protein
MVLQMVEPMVKRQIIERDFVAEMKNGHDAMKRKIDECEFIIHKSQKKTSSNEEINKKIDNNVSNFL